MPQNDVAIRRHRNKQHPRLELVERLTLANRIEEHAHQCEREQATRQSGNYSEAEIDQMSLEGPDERPHPRREAEDIASAQPVGRRKSGGGRGRMLVGGSDLRGEEILFAGSAQGEAVEAAAPCAPGICAPANARRLSSSAPVDLHSRVVSSCASP